MFREAVTRLDGRNLLATWRSYISSFNFSYVAMTSLHGDIRALMSEVLLLLLLLSWALDCVHVCPLGWLPYFWLAVVVRVVVDFFAIITIFASFAVAAAAIVFVEIVVAGFAFYFVVVVATSLFYFSINKNRKEIKLKPKKIHSLYLFSRHIQQYNNSFLNIHNHFYLLFFFTNLFTSWNWGLSLFCFMQSQRTHRHGLLDIRF